ncbi:PstS family phosphate ABC transporter substrate-binding protein [Bacillus sp. Marseille-Q1617]|uniref:PstS family phosphate ABC transporter substrate-binding protein n=1 Tax=Bacillus sp. Marseille-Q1617 TaxID=2736887 RepID=UPI00158BD10A|nr:PstS family phosphate ABC transporter substrate-binding protein [Bacillus sp. Marseille-Q1617]
MKSFKRLAMTAMVGSALLLGACGAGGGAESNGEQLSGTVKVDGSSTVAPIAEAINEEYAGVQPDVKVSIGVSGSGGGFEKFIAGETDLSNASRPIKDEEKSSLEEAGIDFTEFKVANDGLSVVVNKDNDWVEEMTMEDLRKLWLEDGKTKKWSDINPEWPDEEVKFYSPGTDSGTYDFFHEEVLEEKDMVRQNIQLSEDDNVLVTGVTGDKNAIGFFGYAHYLANKDQLKVVKIDGVEPTNETVESGDYPLSRPLFVYAKNESMKNNEAAYDYMKYTLENAGDMAEAVGYVSLQEDQYKEALETLEGLKK